MDPQLLSLACNLYSTSPDLLTPLSGGHYNAVYQFSYGEKSAILRIGVEDCPAEQTLAMLDWVRFLSDEGAPVTTPLASINNHLMERLEYDGTRYILTSFEKASGILAEDIPPAQWIAGLFNSIGSAVGKFHRISRRYHPSAPSLVRPLWFESSEILEATRLLATSHDPARGKLNSLINQLKPLPTDSSDFGLIHGDLHFANFLILPDNQVAIIDFDDCVYSWFAMDVAMALFDMLVLYNPTSEDDSQRFAHYFLTSYLSGYRQENVLPQYWLSQIPQFLKLKELCIYATLIGHADIALPDSWVGRFMRNRSERLAHDLPYVNIDYPNL